MPHRLAMRRSMYAGRRNALRAVSLVAAVSMATAAGAPPVYQAPGLAVGSVIHDGLDYESLSVVKTRNADGMRTVIHWTVPDPDAPGGRKESSANLMTRAADLESARRLILVHVPGDPDTFPGALTQGISRTVYAELKSKGEAAIVLGAARRSNGGLLADLFAGRKYYRGTLKRVENSPVPFPVLLDGRRTNLPALHAKGDVAVGTDAGTAEFWFLDDADRPLTLKWIVLGATAQAVRIDNPRTATLGSGDAGGAPSLTAGLDSSSCRAELHGVYFNTGSAELLPESAAALAEVASALNAHADWHVLVEGHTDNIGTADSNLTLSTRRAEAVRQALISGHAVVATRLDAKGFGATRPVENNATVEGRAHNRRVELSRRCP
jgi:outer membrane protein OmpA-like peptidoglycan-associated protein